MAIIVETDIPIVVRDGCQILADIYRPADDEAHSTIINVTYVNKQSRNGMALLINPIVAVEHGYAVVIADCRGTYRSGGDWKPFEGHGDDGYDIVEWSARQPWSNGNVGIYGSSGHGVTALQTAVAAPPHLRGVMLIFTGANYFDGWAYTSGVFELAFAHLWAARVTGPSLVSRMDDGDPRKDELARALASAVVNGRGLVRQLPLTDDELLPRDAAPWLYEWLEHSTYDDYWKQVDAVVGVAQIKAPVLQVAGWYDLFLPGQIALNRAITESGDRLVRGASRIIVGPWAHEAYIGNRTTIAGDRDFGPQADAGPSMTTRLGLEWFDRWLDGKDYGAAVPGSTVRYFTIGAESWTGSEAWPPSSHEVALYLHSQGRANSRFGDGVLSDEPPAAEPPDSYRYDPLHPTPSVGGPTIYLLESGIRDQSRTEERDDILVYTSALLQGAITIAGAPVLDLYAASSAVDTDFTAKLIDVEPDGYCANVAEGIARASVALGPQGLKPSVPVRLRIELNDIAYRFELGHRIRLEVASANFPRFARNLNSGVHPHRAASTDAIVAVQRVLHAAENPSRLLLPLID